MRRLLIALAISSAFMWMFAEPGGAAAGLPSPSLFKGYVKQAYQAAHDNYALANKLFCYCGCDHVQKYKRLIDCFRNEHAVKCSICQDEMIRAAGYKKQGMSTAAIAKKIDAEFKSRYPNSTPSQALQSYQKLHKH
jgi:hypothetical protein